MTKRTGFKVIASFLSTLGKPFYYALLLIFVGLLFFVSLIKKPGKLIFSLVRRPRRRKTKILFPKKRVSLELLGFILGSLIALFTICFLLFAVLKDLPSPKNLGQQNRSLTTKIYDRNGQLLYKIYREKNRTFVPLAQLPTSLIYATISLEDKDFYRHSGLSWRGIGRAVYQDIVRGKKTGGSTITQQLVKNTLLSPEKTLRRKAKEAILAILVEKIYTKNQILEMYLNSVSYGGNTYGVEEASQKYFNKSARDLSFAESALLAGLPASPTRFSPFGNQPQLAKERQVLVLKRMTEEGYLTQEEANEIKKQELKLATPKEEILAPHFVMYIKDLLVQKYGEKLVEEGGLEVTTSLDLRVQEKSQKIVKEEIKKLGNLHITNGAVLVTNPKTGEILAMVGSKDYFAKDIDGNFNVTTSPRQPGSAIKPVNYSIALENGFTPATLLDDSPITYHVAGQPPYSPENYDRRFHGQIPLRVALGSSYNVPAVKVLAAFGVKKMVERGREMGITSSPNTR